MKRRRKRKTTSAGSNPLIIPVGSTRDGAADFSYEYRLGSPKGGMSDEEKARLQERFDELRVKKAPVYDEKVREKEMNENEAAAALLLHDVLGQLAGEFRIGYCRVLKRVGLDPLEF